MIIQEDLLKNAISKKDSSNADVSRLVYIKDVKRPSAQMRHLHTTKDGRIMEKTKSKDAKTHFTPSISTTHNQLNTGFWEKIKNPYKKDAKSLPSVWQGKGIEQRDEITIQEYLEIKYNHPPGFYTSEKPDMFNRKNAKATYLQSFRYKLNQGTTILDLDKERDEIMYLLALRSTKIANSKEEANTAIHSHYIAEVNESSNEKAKKAEIFESAVSKLFELKNKHDSETVRKFAVNLKIIKNNISDEATKVRLSEFINDPSKKYENIDKFNEMYDLFTGDKTKKYRFNTIYFLQELINNRVTYLDRGKVVWGNAPSEDLQTLGNTFDSAVEWLMMPESKEWRERLSEELKAKTGLVVK